MGLRGGGWPPPGSATTSGMAGGTHWYTTARTWPAPLVRPGQRGRGRAEGQAPGLLLLLPTGSSCHSACRPWRYRGSLTGCQMKPCPQGQANSRPQTRPMLWGDSGPPTQSPGQAGTRTTGGWRVSAGVSVTTGQAKARPFLWWSGQDLLATLARPCRAPHSDAARASNHAVLTQGRGKPWALFMP